MTFWTSVELVCAEVGGEKVAGEAFGFLGVEVATHYLSHSSVDGFETVLGFLLANGAVGGALL